ncbi:MAG TPA: S8 family serine peptidase [Candidatus Angelobacter sp.]|jgi:subtilisin family serine protease|nr:S8 family serine peptidase [Candidatus Angelobacter sp.]
MGGGNGGGRGLLVACAAVAAWAASGASVAAAAGPGGVTSAPDDPAFRAHSQWGLVQAGFPAAWCRSTGAGALIVVIDTGIAAAHPDLAGKLAGEAAVHQGAVTSGPGTASDDSGHGTHVAGIAAAVTGNGIGIAGAAPDARLYAIKVLFADSSGGTAREQGTRTDLVQAIDYATTMVAPSWPGPVVLNLSIGAADAGSSDSLSGTSSADVDGAIERAAAAGLGVAVAAGNAGTAAIGGDAVAAGAALSVGALDQNGSVAPYSPTAGVSIFAAGGTASAPDRYTGTGILSTWLHSSSGDYAWMAGTSMAAPHVAAALAMLMSTGLSNQDAYARLLSTADAQRRMHIDVALGSTAPCGVASPAPPRAAVRPARVAPPSRAAAGAPAQMAGTPSATAASSASPVALPLTAGPRIVAAAAPVSGGGHPALTRIALGLGALLLLWLVVVRRALRSP